MVLETGEVIRLNRRGTYGKTDDGTLTDDAVKGEGCFDN